jgi:hypothetical protein
MQTESKGCQRAARRPGLRIGLVLQGASNGAF